MDVVDTAFRNLNSRTSAINENLDSITKKQRRIENDFINRINYIRELRGKARLLLDRQDKLERSFKDVCLSDRPVFSNGYSSRNAYLSDSDDDFSYKPRSKVYETTKTTETSTTSVATPTIKVSKPGQTFDTESFKQNVDTTEIVKKKYDSDSDDDYDPVKEREVREEERRKREEQLRLEEEEEDRLWEEEQKRKEEERMARRLKEQEDDMNETEDTVKETSSVMIETNDAKDEDEQVNGEKEEDENVISTSNEVQLNIGGASTQNFTAVDLQIDMNNNTEERSHDSDLVNGYESEEERQPIKVNIKLQEEAKQLDSEETDIQPMTVNIQMSKPADDSLDYDDQPIKVNIQVGKLPSKNDLLEDEERLRDEALARAKEIELEEEEERRIMEKIERMKQEEFELMQRESEQ